MKSKYFSMPDIPQELLDNNPQMKQTIEELMVLLDDTVLSYEKVLLKKTPFLKDFPELYMPIITENVKEIYDKSLKKMFEDNKLPLDK